MCQTHTPVIIMKLFLIFFVLGLPLFVLTSTSNTTSEVISTKTVIPEKYIYFLAGKDSKLNCSICHTALGQYDLVRKPCEHGLHVHCLQDAFENRDKDIMHHKNCNNCKMLNKYVAFLSHLIFVSPELPEGIKFIPELMSDLNVIKVWANAMGKDSPEALKRLIQIGMPETLVDENGKPVHLIVLAGYKATPANLEFLLDSKVRLCSDESKTFVSGYLASISAGNVENAAVFLKRGVNVNAVFPGGTQNAINTAIKKGVVQSVKFLIEKNVDLNTVTPLNLAIISDNAEIVDLLIKSEKVNLNAFTQQGRTPVVAAACAGKLNALAALIDNNASTSINTVEGLSLLQYVIISGPTCSVKFLLERGFLPIDNNGLISYLLHLAITMKKTDTVKYLLENGANPNEYMSNLVFERMKTTFPSFANEIKHTDPPIVIAILFNDFEAFEALLKAGTDPNSKIFNYTSSLLHLVCKLENVRMAKRLIELGADHVAPDANNLPPFRYSNQDFFNAVFYS